MKPNKKITISKEEILFSDLKEHEKAIYEAGYDEGTYQASLALTIFFCFVIAVIVIFFLTHK